MIAPPEARTPQLATQWLGHTKRWSACKLCPIGCVATEHVFGRGELDCDWAFVGEGPGKSEDILGLPFMGRAGKLLDEAILQSGGARQRIFITNLVACRPTDAAGGPNRQPSDTEVLNCKKRFAEALALANPKRGIILLGRVPAYFFQSLSAALPSHLQKIAVHELTHPAAILRRGGIGSAEFTIYVSKLRDVFHGKAK